jgi:hypothetical protein
MHGHSITKVGEEFRAVPGYEGLYELTRDGRLFSVERRIFQDDSQGRRFYRLIKRREKSETVNGRGYRAFNLHKDNKQTCRLITSLLRDTFGIES